MDLSATFGVMSLCVFDMKFFGEFLTLIRLHRYRPTITVSHHVQEFRLT